MELGTLFRYIDIGLACLAGLWGLILLFRNTSAAWKWVALAGLLWALTTCLAYFLPAVWDARVLNLKIFVLIQRLGMGLCLFIGMLSAR